MSDAASATGLDSVAVMKKLENIVTHSNSLISIVSLVTSLLLPILLCLTSTAKMQPLVSK